MNIIVDDIRAVVDAMKVAMTPVPAPDLNAPGAGAPYYMAGHPLEISNRLLERNMDAVFKYQKYPLVALRLDTRAKKEDGIVKYNLNIILVAFTDKKYNAEERLENVFKPVLYPLYELFLKELKNSGLFFWEGNQDRPEHTQIDRFFWGTETNMRNEKYIFNDPLDAIEIVDLKISSTIKNC